MMNKDDDERLLVVRWDALLGKNNVDDNGKHQMQVFNIDGRYGFLSTNKQ